MVEDRFRKDAQTEERWHLTLLAENQAGYRNLLKLGSLSFLEGYYFKPRVDYESAQGALRGHHLPLRLSQRTALARRCSTAR